MNPVARAREWWLMPRIEERREFYRRDRSPAEIGALQLARFNAEWPGIRRHVPFYKDLAERRMLPEIFNSWEEILEAFPVVNRETVQQNGRSMTSRLRPPQWWRKTGGSTAQPVHLPAWKSETQCTAPNVWVAKSWFGVRPSDRLFLIWGIGQFTDRGLKGRYKLLQRKCRDVLLGYRRYPAYILGDETLHGICLSLLRFRPSYLAAYSAALVRFALANEHLAPSFHRLGLKVVAGASEAFPRDDSPDLISRIFGAPVAMEYGMNETDLLAHTRPEGGFHVFWGSYFFEAVEPGASGGRKLRVTCLFPRCFPLIRYETGDEVELEAGDAPLGITRFRSLKGRTADIVTLSDGTILHCHGFDVAIRACPEITGYQAVLREGRLSLHYLSGSPVPDCRLKRIREILLKVHPSLAQIEIRRTGRLEQTADGKTKALLRM